MIVFSPKGVEARWMGLPTPQGARTLLARTGTHATEARMSAVITDTIAVLDQGRPRSRQLADALDLPLVREADGDMLLAYVGSRLEVRFSQARPLWVDFVGPEAHRHRRAGRRSHPLARAVGRKQPLPAIVDATAGLGRDAWVLASLGYEVVAVERSTILHALLANGLARATESGSEVCQRLRLQLVAGDARDYLARTQPPDVVYMDPMFPKRTKSALVKKEMQFFHKLLGAEEDAGSLFEVARSVAKRRVVVKRPRKAPPLTGRPSYQVQGGRVRWDVYLSSR